MVVAQIEAHGYDAVVSIPSGELRPVAELAAYVEVDSYRVNNKRPPFYALFIPPPVVADRPFPRHLKAKVRALAEKTQKPLLKREVEFLSSVRLRVNTYPMFYKLLEYAVSKRLISKNDRDEILLGIADVLCSKPGPPPFFENSNTNRAVLYGLGLIPNGMELLSTEPDMREIERVIGGFLKALTSREASVSVSKLVAANAENAVRLWSSLNAATDWSFHFSYLDSFMDLPEEEQLTPTYISSLCSETPSLAMFPPAGEPSLHQWASDISAGKVGGLETVMKAMRDYDPELVRSAPVIDGSWEERIAYAPKPDGVYVKTEPTKEASGIVELRGNFCESSVARVSGLSEDEMTRFDKKTYLAVFYYNEEDALSDLFESSEILDKVKTIVTMDDLLSLFSLNYPDRLDDFKVYSKLKKDELFDRLVDDRLMRIFVAVAGEGPVSNGMRQIYYPVEYLQRDVRLRHITVLCTDGRLSGYSWGPFIGHCSPEGMEGGGVAAIETGELVYVDFENGIINALDKDSSFDLSKIVLLSKNEIQRRPLGGMRQKKMGEDRLALPLSLRSILNAITPTTSGAAPFLGR
jgi:dihydroxyacid dehydratase/phosphogluconate dehydratase